MSVCDVSVVSCPVQVNLLYMCQWRAKGLEDVAGISVVLQSLTVGNGILGVSPV